jgi:hypothetical protein
MDIWICQFTIDKQTRQSWFKYIFGKQNRRMDSTRAYLYVRREFLMRLVNSERLILCLGCGFHIGGWFFNDVKSILIFSIKMPCKLSVAECDWVESVIFEGRMKVSLESRRVNSFPQSVEVDDEFTFPHLQRIMTLFQNRLHLRVASWFWFAVAQRWFRLLNDS